MHPRQKAFLSIFASRGAILDKVGFNEVVTTSIAVWTESLSKPATTFLFESTRSCLGKRKKRRSKKNGVLLLLREMVRVCDPRAAGLDRLRARDHPRELFILRVLPETLGGETARERPNSLRTVVRRLLWS